MSTAVQTSRWQRGIPFLVAAPSGSGKTTVCKAVLERDASIRFSVSHTTRSPRANEVEGRDYYFVTEGEFRALVSQGAFLEYAEYAGRLYGTSWASLEEPLDSGFDLLLEIEVQGAEQVHDRRDDVRFIFLLPPSLAALEQRLRLRGTDADEAIDQRLALVGRELEAARFFDYAVVNDRLEECVENVLEIVRAERSQQIAGVRERFGRERVLKAWRRSAEAS